MAIFSETPQAPDFNGYQLGRVTHWNNVAIMMRNPTWWGKYYHYRLQEVYKNIVPRNQRVLELGCGQGNLLAALQPSFGVGVDFSCEMVNQARVAHSDLEFFQSDVHDFETNEKFDYIILSDLINDLWDLESVFNRIYTWSTPKTRIITNFYSRVWEIQIALAEKFNIKRPTLVQNWLTQQDIRSLFELSTFEVIKNWEEILLPIQIPLITSLSNKFFVRFWPLSLFAVTNFVVAKPKPFVENKSEYSVSIIIPAKNEAGNIPELISRVPNLGKFTEIIFVEGNSKDDTYNVIQKEMVAHPEKNCRLLKQKGVGKGDAVRLGFEHSQGDILMILDADLSVAPEDLRRFYKALVTGKGELINGVRLVYPMGKHAMQFFNLLGNKLFGLVISWLLNCHIKDTLCGTKVLWKSDYQRIDSNRHYFGDFDPFGDFDLIFGAAKSGLKILDLPIRYRERKYGQTNIQRWKHGLILLRMVIFAAKRIKFI